MNLLQQSALAWKEITKYRYLFTYGYKKKLYPINLTFSLEDYPHLAGFQYTKDISLPNYTSAKIVNRILEGKIPFEKVQKATQYEEMIKPRLETLIYLKIHWIMNLPFIHTCRECILLSPILRPIIFLQAILILIASFLSYAPPLKAKPNVISFAVLFLKKETVIMKQTKDLLPYSRKNAYIFQLIHPQLFWTSLVHHHEAEASLLKSPVSYSFS